MKKEEDLMYIDFQGWPVYKMNLREILIALGGRKEGGNIVIDDNELLDIYPRTLEDDGMGYGVNEKFITEVYMDKERKEFCNIFVDNKKEN